MPASCGISHVVPSLRLDLPSDSQLAQLTLIVTVRHVACSYSDANVCVLFRRYCCQRRKDLIQIARRCLLLVGFTAPSRSSMRSASTFISTARAMARARHHRSRCAAEERWRVAPQHEATRACWPAKFGRRGALLGQLGDDGGGTSTSPYSAGRRCVCSDQDEVAKRAGVGDDKHAGRRSRSCRRLVLDLALPLPPQSRARLAFAVKVFDRVVGHHAVLLVKSVELVTGRNT
jgi:hypothetical protein